MSQFAKECYADQTREKYPIFSKEAALKSFDQFRKDLDKYDTEEITRITNNFIKAANTFDISYAVPEEDQPEKDTYETSAGTLTISKIASQQNLDDFVSSLDEIRKDVPLNQIRKIAADVLFKTQAAIDTPAQRRLQIYAGIGVCQPQGIVKEFKKRAFIVNLPRSAEKQFYDTYNVLQEVSTDNQQQFFKCAAVLCDTLDQIDRMYKLQQYYGTKLGRPEEVCFGQTIDDLVNEAQDYLHVDSTDTILSKKALLEAKPAVMQFLKDKYQLQPKDDEQMLKKVSSLSETGIKGLVNAIEEHISE